MEHVRIGVSGGSGLYDIPELKNLREVRLETPFGTPSDSYFIGEIDGVPVAFLARHGRGHCISPTRVNYRANIYGFKLLGVEYLISAHACGSLQPEYQVSDMVIPDQIFDRTRLRPLSFFDDPACGTEGIVAHVSVADPFCPFLSRLLADKAEQQGQLVHRGGTFVIIEGPRFSTKAESRIFKEMGFAIVGMTVVPEAFLAREAGMSYAVIAHVTDYDVWHETEAPVTADVIIRRLLTNVENAKKVIIQTVIALRDAPPTPFADALKDAVVTRPDKISAAARQRIGLLIGKYVG